MAQIARNSNFNNDVLEHFSSLISDTPSKSFASDLGRAFAVAVPWITYTEHQDGVELFHNKQVATMHDQHIVKVMSDAMNVDPDQKNLLACAFLEGVQDTHLFQSAGMPYTNEKITAPQFTDSESVIATTVECIEEKYQKRILACE